MLAEAGQTHVITRYNYHGRATNPRTQFQKIIKWAGVEPWPKPWQNLRSSREAELTEDFPLHVVTAWIGNTEAVAKRRYLQVTEDHFSKAVESGAESATVAVQKAVQQPAASSGSESQETKQALAEQEVVRSYAGTCEGTQNPLVGVTGLEADLVSDCHRNDLQQSPDSFGTESGTVGGETGTFPPELRAIVSAWPTLSVDDRKAVLAIVREAATRAQ